MREGQAKAENNSTLTLRDRIAAAIDQHGSKGNNCWCGWEWNLDQQNHYGHHLADAVIAELALREEHEIVSETGPRHRYVTYWQGTR